MRESAERRDPPDTTAIPETRATTRAPVAASPVVLDPRDVVETAESPDVTEATEMMESLAPRDPPDTPDAMESPDLLDAMVSWDVLVIPEATPSTAPAPSELHRKCVSDTS